MPPRPPIDALFCLAAVAQTGTQVAEIALSLDREPGYSSTTLASITVTTVMIHLKPVLQSHVGITTNEKRTTIPGQTPRHQFLRGQQTAGFLRRLLVPQGLGYPKNVWALRATDGNESELLRKHLEATQEGCADVLASPPLVVAAPFPTSHRSLRVTVDQDCDVPQEVFLLYRNHRLTRACPSVMTTGEPRNSASHPKPSSTRASHHQCLDIASLKSNHVCRRRPSSG